MKRSIVFLGSMFFLFALFGVAHADLVGYWDFDENTGDIAHDSSGYGNDGIIQGASWDQGKYGSGLSFDGVDDWISVANSSSINTSTFTVSEWVSLADLDSTQVLLDKRNGQWWRNYGLYYYANDKPEPTDTPADYLAVIIGNNTFAPTNYSNAAYAAVDLDEDVFYYISATYDLTTLNLYLNGELIGSSYLPMTGTTGSGDLYIGSHGDPFTYSGRTKGIIDDVRIYDHVLTQSEILADMTAPVPEPATMLLLGSGLIGIVIVRKKYFQKKILF